MQIFDAHFHIIDQRFKIVPNQGYLPNEFTVDDYLHETHQLDLIGGAVVSGSFQAFDREYLKQALRTLGSNFFGVANIPHDISDEEIKELSTSNIVGVRFNLKRGGSEQLRHLANLSARLSDQYGWHTELYVDSKDLAGLRPTLSRLRRFTIDHLGLSKIGLREVLHWAERGQMIKATGFGRIDFDPTEAMKQIHSVNPHSLMFGTDLPSTRAPRPFSIEDLRLIEDNFDKIEQERIFRTNAQNWYDQSKPS